MKQSTLIWTLLMVFGGLGLLSIQIFRSQGAIYVREVPVEAQASQPESPEQVYRWSKYQQVPATEKGEPGVSFSLSRTIGLWVAAFCTLAIFSFLYGDNPLYKFTESVFVGVSAGYAMVVAFWTEIVTNLFAKLLPGLARISFFPDMEEGAQVSWLYLVPLVLSVLLLWRLAPKGNWIARWPLAFFIGATAGIRLISYLEADFVGQIQNTIMPFIVFDSKGSFLWIESLRNSIVIVGVLSCMVYFFFSIEHEGIVKYISRLGVWFLMVTFGASFAYTVMGRIALLSGRLNFLFNDWLGI
ncbi:hypothetical protein [Gimesia fumaroli]|uniref:Uncharacterized protein n=1 Tax=Gimesia fumaroli TaxID=2527976 RepID=A0A518IG99_9PLAN|nr:hypothetical protein [Gimesia fumaroli]QDV52106.1 hypothetical protein Enr17x_41650 [Gimesia fumaroli]